MALSIKDILGRSTVHPFPARMAPVIAMRVLKSKQVPLVVLDPMSGSGTVLAIAQSLGHRSVGFDVDPLAVLMANVWTKSISHEAVTKRAKLVLRSAIAKYNYKFNVIESSDSYPLGCDTETKNFIRYWFDTVARKRLSSLANAISEVKNRKIRDVLWCAFSRLIIRKSSGASRAMDLSHSRPHRVYARAPLNPFLEFTKAVASLLQGCPKLDSAFKLSTIRKGDSRKLKLANNSVDLVVTSPPYLNAIDYMRCSKFSLVWMGYNINEIRGITAKNIGSRASAPKEFGRQSILETINTIRGVRLLPSKFQKKFETYARDMDASVSEVARVLKPGGTAVYVVGDCNIKGVFISNSRLVSILAVKNGLSLRKRSVRVLPPNRRYLPPPNSISRGLDGIANRMRTEVVLSFERAETN